jgi:DNA-binding response OmpR family regulator
MVSGTDAGLTPTEFRMLAELVRREGAPVSPKELLTVIWGADYRAEYLVKWHVSRLRRKLRPANGGGACPIVTRRGFGYAYQAPVTS